MKYIVLFLLSFFLVFSCTNWKAKYLITKGDLDNCLNVKPKQEVITREKKVKDKSAAKSDTIYIEQLTPGDKQDEIKTSHHISNIQPSVSNELYYEKKYDLSLNKDSVNVWLTIENRLIGNTFIQTVQIDSVSYPEIKTINEYTKINTIREYNRWKMLIWGFIGGLIIFGIFAFFWTKYKR